MSDNRYIPPHVCKPTAGQKVGYMFAGAGIFFGAVTVFAACGSLLGI